MVLNTCKTKRSNANVFSIKMWFNLPFPYSGCPENNCNWPKFSQVTPTPNSLNGFSFRHLNKFKSDRFSGFRCSISSSKASACAASSSRRPVAAASARTAPTSRTPPTPLVTTPARLLKLARYKVVKFVVWLNTRNTFYKGQGDFQLVCPLEKLPKWSSFVPSMSPNFLGLLWELYFVLGHTKEYGHTHAYFSCRS